MRVLVAALCSLLPAAALAGEPVAPESALAAGWRALHPDRALPAPCPHPDQVRQIAADLDEQPGRETALASRRFGVVLFAADGHALAGLDSSCGAAGAAEPPEVRELLAVRASGRAPADLVVRAREQGRCGQVSTWTILGRRDRVLYSRLSVDESTDLSCGNSPHLKTSAKIEVPALGTVRVTVDGTSRPARPDGEPGPPAPVHRVTTFVASDGAFHPQR